MQQEKRLWLSVLLLVVAQQEVKFARQGSTTTERRKKIPEQIADEARHYVSSPQFTTLCQRINLEPKRLRSLTPAQAYEAYKKLTSDDFDEIGVEKELNESD